MKYADLQLCDRTPQHKWCIQRQGYPRNPWQAIAPYERLDRHGQALREFPTWEEARAHVARFIDLGPLSARIDQRSDS